MISATFSAVAMIVCYLAAGPSLGLFFAGFFVVTFLVPATALAASSYRDVVKGIACAAAPVAAAWYISITKSDDTALQVTELCVLLLAYAAALGGVALALAQVRIPRSLACSLVIVIGLAWLTWPVWLSPQLGRFNSGHVVNTLVNLHPPLVANGVLRSRPPWTEMQLAYQLTNLNQDIPVSLPANAAACIGACAVLALGMFSVTRARPA